MRPSPEQKLALYDAEIRYADHHLGEVVAALKRRGLYDQTWIIVTADHGELFGEHGVNGHGSVPYQEVLHVPLVSKPPRADGGRGERTERVQLTDVMPLVLERLGLPRPDGIQGGVPPRLDHPIMAESYTLAALYKEGDWLAIFDGDWKFMWNSQGHSALYDLAADPRETTNLITEHPDRVATLGRTMNEYLRALPRAQGTQPARAVDAQTRDALKSLGYIH
jgi:arylsulfatase A-like enzyme